MRIFQTMLDEIVAHAREEAPNECCGMIGARDGGAASLYRARNAEASPAVQVSRRPSQTDT